MKKALVITALILGLGSASSFAQDVKVTTSKDTTIVDTTAIKGDFVKKALADTPPLIMNALAKSYEGASIKEIYVAERETGKVYKIVIVGKDETEKTIYMNDKGEETTK